MDINVVLPAGALGRVDDEDKLTSMLRDIGVAIEKADPAQHGRWAEKYGAEFDCDEFMMHPYCWCEQESCPWCRNCDCPDSAFHYFADGVEVSYDEWMAFFERHADGGSRKTKMPHDEWMKLADAVNQRRPTRHDPVCEFCTKYGGKTEPNFHHKPTGLKVWWYKYIGRSMEVEVGTATDVAPILAACLAMVPNVIGDEK